MYRRGTRTAGVSKKVTVVTARNGRQHRSIYTAGSQRQRVDTQSARRLAALTGMCYSNDQDRGLTPDAELSYNDWEVVTEMDTSMNNGDEDLSVFATLPLGDEGFDISNAGGEHNEFEDMAKTLSGWAGM